MELYVDIIFMVNLVMDYFLLWSTSRLLQLKTKKKRLLLGAFSGSLIYSVSLFLNIGAAGFILSELVLILGLWISFAPKTAKAAAVIFLTIHITAFAVGGVCLMLFYFTDLEGLAGGLVGLNLEYFSFKLLIGSVALSYISIKLFLRYINRRLACRQKIYRINIFVSEEVVSLDALMDTGNSLREPITQFPVIITEMESFRKMLPERMINLYDSKNEANLSCLTDINGTLFEKRLRLVPYSSIGRANGMLVGFKPDKIELCAENDIIMKEDVVIGLYNCRLSNQGLYQAILSPELIEA